MDMRVAEKHIKDLLVYVQTIESQKPRMYSKSKKRLEELANICKEVVETISNILQDEVLAADQAVDAEDEFEASSIDVKSALDSMEAKLLELRQFVHLDDLAVVNTTRQDITSSSKKRAFHAYKECLYTLQNYPSSYTEVVECSRLIWRWYDSRFIKNSASSTFRYNIRRFPLWIRDIVVLFGYHHEIGDLSKFTSEFYSWISELESSKSHNFAVPFEVYHFNKNPDPNKMTLSGVVLWDMLCDNGLNSICTELSSDLYPSDDSVYNLVGDYNPDVLDHYTNYKVDSSIIDRCGFSYGGVK